MVLRVLFAFSILFTSLNAAELNKDITAKLKQAGWETHTAQKTGIWVSVAKQRLSVIRNGKVLLTALCSTASKGTGSRAHSNKTPLGWHSIAEKIGDGAPSGAIFEERRFTGRVWTSGQTDTNDLILTRILRLQGSEQGLNKGIGIDSYERFIYIHGTAEEDKLGTCASHGCIRVSNNDVIKIYNLVIAGTPVLITQW